MVLQYKSDELNSKMKKTIRHTENLCDRYLNGKLNSSCRNYYILHNMTFPKKTVVQSNSVNLSTKTCVLFFAETLVTDFVCSVLRLP